MPTSPENNPSGGERQAAGPPVALPRLVGRYVEDPRQALSTLKGKLGSVFKRVGFHLLALIAAGIIADGNSVGEQAALFYFGAICLLPRGFSPRLSSYLFPGVTSLGQLAITLLLGYPLPLSVFLAGSQSWLQRAVIRRFRLGFDWVPFPFLLGGFVQAVRGYDIPLPFFILAAACGLGAYYAAQVLDKRKAGKLEAEALAWVENASPFKHFYLSAADLEAKSAALPAGLQAHSLAISLHTRNILECMTKDPNDVQPGNRFLGRYLPAAHKIVDDYTRLGREGRGHQDIESVLGRVDEVLERLAQAFQQEHGNLLRNDAMQLSAEMQVLDKLLKMDGR